MLTALLIILPIFLVIGLGVFLRWREFVTPDGSKALSRFVFRIAAPLYLLRSIGSKPISESAHFETIVIIVGVTVLTAAVTYLASRGQSRQRIGVMAQGSFRSNTFFFGLPVVTQAYGDAAVSQAAVIIGTMVITYNLLGALVLVLPRQRMSARSTKLWIETVSDMVRNPLVLAILGGIALSSSGSIIPEAIDRTLEMVGRTALPLALLSIGVGLDPRHRPLEGRASLVISMIKLVIYPAAIWWALRAIGLEGDALRIPVVLLSSPCAIMSYIMVKEMSGDEQLASAFVIGTTLMSVVTSVGWLVFLG